jgi:hypothetical protein
MDENHSREAKIKLNGPQCHRRRMTHIFDYVPFLGISVTSISVSGNVRLQKQKLNGPQQILKYIPKPNFK